MYPMRDKKTLSKSVGGKEAHNQMIIQQNPSKLWMTYDNDKCFLMIIKSMSIARSNEDNFA